MQAGVVDGRQRRQAHVASDDLGERAVDAGVVAGVLGAVGERDDHLRRVAGTRVRSGFLGVAGRAAQQRGEPARADAVMSFSRSRTAHSRSACTPRRSTRTSSTWCPPIDFTGKRHSWRHRHAGHRVAPTASRTPSGAVRRTRRCGVVDPDDGLVAGLQERRLAEFGVAGRADADQHVLRGAHWRPSARRRPPAACRANPSGWPAARRSSPAAPRRSRSSRAAGCRRRTRAPGRRGAQVADQPQRRGGPVRRQVADVEELRRHALRRRAPVLLVADLRRVPADGSSSR